MKDEPETIFDRPVGSKPRAPDEPLAPPSGHQRYEVHTEIARGGMGRVVEATDTLLGRTVAVKEALGGDDEALRRFRREIYITARLEHPSIVPVHDAGTNADGSPFYVMRKVTGRPLTELIAQASTLEARLALLPHVVAAAQAIAHAHGRDVIHRDIKPSNILVGELGETVVIDWGLAKVVGESDETSTAPVDAGSSLRTRFGVVFGTPGFMAPEQARGEKVDARSDVYALGATLYFTFTREPPHASADEDEMMVAAASGPPQPIAEVVEGLPRELSSIVDKALAYDDRERYANAGELAEELQRFISGQLVASHRYSSRERLTRFVRKNRVAVAVASIALVTVILGGALAVRSIVAARDRADAQAALATARAIDTDLARKREEARGDQLLLLQAENLSKTNPTAAIALLKQLTAIPERYIPLWRRVRAIAETASYNGVARVLPAPDFTASCRISQNGKRAVALSRDGVGMVYDLDAMVSQPLVMEPIMGVEFVDDDHLLGYTETALLLHDLVTQTTRKLAVDHLQEFQSSPDAIFARDYLHHTLHRIDRATLVDRVLAVGEEVTAYEISRDHRWLAVSGKQHIMLVDLAHGDAIRMIDTAPGLSIRWDPTSTEFVVNLFKEARGYSLDGKRVMQRSFGNDVMLDSVTVSPTENYFALTSGLYVTQGPGLLPLSRHGTPDVNTQLYMMGSVPLVSRGDHIDFLGDFNHTLYSPTGVLGMIAVSRHKARVIGYTQGHLVVWDLSDQFPSAAQFPVTHTFAMVGDRYVTRLSHVNEWSWLDFTNQTQTSIPEIHFPVAGLTSNGGDAFVMLDPTDDDRMFGVRDGKAHEIIEHDIRDAVALKDDRIVAATAAGDLLIYDREYKRSLLAHHTGTLADLNSNGDWFAASFTDGFVIRYNERTNQLETTQLTLTGLGPIATSRDGTVFIGIGNAIVRWQRDGLLLLHATLPLRIKGRTALVDHVVLTTLDGSSYSMSYTAPGQLVGLPGTYFSWYASSCELGIGNGQTSLLMIDVTNGAMWPIPKPMDTSITDLSGWSLSENAKHAGTIVNGTLYLWDTNIPMTSDETLHWLDRLTNATAELGTATLTFH